MDKSPNKPHLVARRSPASRSSRNLDPSHKATSNLAVRQAIELALDKTQVAALGEDGQQLASNQTGVITPGRFQKYFDASAFGNDRRGQARRRQGQVAADRRRLHRRQTR